MTELHIIIIILGIALIWGGTQSYKMYLDYNLKVKEINKNLFLSEEETNRQEMIVEIMNKYSLVQDQVLKRKTTRKPRKTPVEKRIGFRKKD